MTTLPRDIRAFLENYPGDNGDDELASANLEFYRNRRKCQPDNVLVSEIHEGWFGDYEKLEQKHGYIQWLFPIREYGVNYAAQPLQSHEIQAMRRDKDVMARVLQSYRIMLDFYGMQLVSPDTGLLARVEPESKYEERYRNLIHSQHNFLRISRILKCLSEMGLERLNAGFLLHVLNEQSEHDQLNTRSLRDSMDRWWANCIRDDGERAWVGGAIRRVRDGGQFMREDYVRALERRRETGKLGEVGQEEVERAEERQQRKEEDSESEDSESEESEEEEE